MFSPTTASNQALYLASVSGAFGPPTVNSGGSVSVGAYFGIGRGGQGEFVMTGGTLTTGNND